MQVRAKLHNDLVHYRMAELAVGLESQRLKKFTQMQEKQRNAAEKRAKLSCKVKNSGLYFNAA